MEDDRLLLLNLKNEGEDKVSRKSSDKNEEEKSELCQWTERIPDGFVPVGATIQELVSGLYMPIWNGASNSTILKKENKKHFNNIITFQGSVFEEILNEVKIFWDSEEEFTKNGFIHKRGLLFLGSPGGGKTSLLHLLQNQIIELGGIVLLFKSPDTFMDGLKMIKDVEPRRKILAVLEDIDDIIHEYGERCLLEILDGSIQYNNCLFVATTNYPEKLPDRIIKRPGRFDKIIYIENPTQEIKSEYLKIKLGIDSEQIEASSQILKKFSFSHLSEVVKLCKCFSFTFETAVNKVNSSIKENFSSEKFDRNNKTGYIKEGEE